MPRKQDLLLSFLQAKGGWAPRTEIDFYFTNRVLTILQKQKAIRQSNRDGVVGIELVKPLF